MHKLPHWLVALFVALIAMILVAFGIWAKSTTVWILMAVGLIVFVLVNWLNPSYWHRRVIGGLLVGAWACHWIAVEYLSASVDVTNAKLELYLKATADNEPNIATFLILALIFLPGEFGLFVDKFLDKFREVGLLKSITEDTTKESFLRGLIKELESEDRAKATFQLLQTTYGLFPVDTSKDELTPNSTKIALAQVEVAYKNERNRLIARVVGVSVFGLVVVVAAIGLAAFAYSNSNEEKPQTYKYQTIKKFEVTEIVDSIFRDVSVGESNVETGIHCENLKKNGPIRFSIVPTVDSETIGKKSTLTQHFPSPANFRLILVVEFADLVKVHRGDELVITGMVGQISSSNRGTLYVYITRAKIE